MPTDSTDDKTPALQRSKLGFVPQNTVGKGSFKHARTPASVDLLIYEVDANRLAGDHSHDERYDVLN